MNEIVWKALCQEGIKQKTNPAANFWRRMATNNSAAITIKSSHPTTPERFLALETTVKEIKAKIDNKQPLKPEMKNSTDPK